MLTVKGWRRQEHLAVGAVGGGTEDVDFVSATGFADTATAVQLLGAGTNVDGQGMETAGATGTITFVETPGGTSEVEFECSIIVNGGNVTDGDVINFRWLYSEADAAPPATVLHTSPGNNNATLTVDKPSAGIVIPVMDEGMLTGGLQPLGGGLV